MDSIKSNIHFDFPSDQPAIIKVIGVGGGGSNAVNQMHDKGIDGVKFIICNTDAQSLTASNVPNKVQLGPNLTAGRGAGANPEKGKHATHESIEEIRQIIGEDTQMLFITAGMGGGTGTGGAPVVAKLARDMGVLTVGIVTTPFTFEGGSRKGNAYCGIDEMRQYVDTLIVISNNKVLEMYPKTPVTESFKIADNVLETAVRSIAEIITVTGIVNVDFADVEAVMRDSGVAIMGAASATGEDRAEKAITEALASPLLNDNRIAGSKNVLLNIRFGKNEALNEELETISTYVQNEAGNNPNIILGICKDEELDDELCITIIATGFQTKGDLEEEETTDKVSDVKEEPVKPTTENFKEVEISDQSDNLKFDSASKIVETNPMIVQPQTSPTQQSVSVQKPIQQPVQKPVVQPVQQPVQMVANKIPDTIIEQQVEIPLDRSEPKNEVNKVTANEEVPEPIEEQQQEPEDIKFEGYTERLPGNEINVDLEKSDKSKSFEEYMKRRKERLSKLSGHTYHSANINELEKEPAYKRRNDLDLNNLPDETEKYSTKIKLIVDEEDGVTKIKDTDKNSFLHDNPD